MKPHHSVLLLSLLLLLAACGTTPESPVSAERGVQVGIVGAQYRTAREITDPAARIEALEAALDQAIAADMPITAGFIRQDIAAARIELERGDAAPAPAPDAPEDRGEFEGITILGTDVSTWKVTSGLDVTFNNGRINLAYDHANTWAGRNEAGAFVNANPWVIAEVNGTTYAATWEWLRKGQTEKSMNAVAGDHIKKREFGPDWRPRSGERLGFFVSGLARGRTRNVFERTEINWVVWP